MNGSARWKVVLLVLATFVVGAVTGGLLTLSSARNEVQEHSDPRKFFTVVPARFGENLGLTAEQEQKIKPILHEIGDELNNQRALDLRETEGILSRGEDRITPLLDPNQREKMHKTFEVRKQRVRQWLGIEDNQKRNNAP